MPIRDDAWLGERVGRRAFRVDVPVAGPVDVAELRGHVAAQAGPAFYYAKVPSERVPVVGDLERVGFGVVDVNVTFERTGASGAASADVEVSEQGPRDEEDVLRIAGTAFRFTRFHLDPGLSAQVANRIKRDWIASYVARTRGDRLFVARLSGRAVGFLAALRGDGVATIDLVAADPEVHRRGVGRALVTAFAAHYAPTCAVLRVGTQVANYPSVRLYEELGFRLAKSEYVLHMHVRPAS